MRYALTAAAGLLAGILIFMALNRNPAPATARAAGGKQATTGGIINLYARDSISQSFSLNDGDYGGDVQNHEQKNRDSQIWFDAYDTGELTAGNQGGEQGWIVDLGDREQLAKQYKYESSETVGGGQGFASIHLENGKLVILKDRREHTYQPMHHLEKLFASKDRSMPRVGSLGNDTSQDEIRKRMEEEQKRWDEISNINHAKIVADHIYLVRIESARSGEIYAKLHVLSFQPGDSVTLRWEVLQP